MTLERWAPKTRTHPTPLALAQYLEPRTRRTKALDVIDRALADLADDRLPADDGGTADALAVFIPAQEGKSTLVSRRFPEWLLRTDPACRVAIVSYELESAMRWGRDIRMDVSHYPELGIALRGDSRAAHRWETPAGGGVYCAGIGGPLTGRGCNVLVVDDPVKDRASAESATMRKTAWDWWENVALTRLAPGAKVVLIQTRWHTDDLAGRILSRPSPLNWRTVIIPAIAGDGDELGREPGDELVSVQGRAPGHFRSLQATMSHYSFAALYQQQPVAAEGNFFRPAEFRYWHPVPPWPDGRPRIECGGRSVTLEGLYTFATVDVAASTKTSADYTVCAVWTVTLEGDLVLLDREREHVAMHDHFSLARRLFSRWGEVPLFVERGFFASTLVADARASGIGVAELRADADKLTRATPTANRVHTGKVWFPAEAPWIDEWTDELAAFPQGAHDDQVDTLAYAARVMTNDYTPPVPDPPFRLPRDSGARDIAAASLSATGHADGIDPMTVDYG